MMGVEDICLNCKDVEHINSGYNGFIGESIIKCNICEDNNINKLECFEEEDKMTEDRIKIIQNGIAKFGQIQLIVSIEELSELQKELCKEIRGKGNKEHITEELADVLIMCETIKQYFFINKKDIDIIIDTKLERIK